MKIAHDQIKEAMINPLYVVIVEDLPYVFSNRKDAENFTFAFRIPPKMLMAINKIGET